MDGPWNRAAAIGKALRLLGEDQTQTDTRIRQAAWIARCVGRGEAAP
jgi:hypothetical protein